MAARPQGQNSMAGRGRELGQDRTGHNGSTVDSAAEGATQVQ
jgi:hypothetical protein